MDRKKNDPMKNTHYIKHIAMKMMFLLPLIFHFLPSFAEHLFELGGRAGLAGYQARCTYVSSAPDMHGGVLLSYTYHSPQVIGVRLSATIDCHRAGFRKAGYTDTYTVIDVEGDPMQVDYSIGLLRENHTVWSVGIPLQLAFSWSHINLYIGSEIVFPFHTSWHETAENTALSVYYPHQDNRVYHSYPLAASPSFAETQEEAHSRLQIRYGLSAELSYDMHLYTSRRTKSYLSVGIYMDYSFTSIRDTPSDRGSLLMLSDTRDGFPLRRILTPVVSAYRQDKRLVTSRRPFAVGVKIAYRIAPYSARKQKAQKCHCFGTTYN